MAKKRKPIAPDVALDLARTVLMRAVLNLDSEGFDYIAWGIYQTSKTAGGFKDKAGWLRIRTACEAYPPIANLQKKFDVLTEAADDTPITVVPKNDTGE